MKRVLASIVLLIMGMLMCGCIDRITDFNKMFSINNNSILNNINIFNNTKNENVEEVNYLKIGESAVHEGVNVTVYDVKFTKNLNEFKEFKPLDRYKYSGIAQPGYKYMVVYVRIKNEGDKNVYVTADDFIVVDSNKNTYKYSLITHLFTNKLELKELKKNECIDGVLVFEVPENETHFKIMYCFEHLADIRSFLNFLRAKWAVWKVPS